MKRFLSLTIALMILTSATAFGAESNVLKLDEALTKSTESSKTLKLDELNIGTAEMAYDTAVDDADAKIMSIEERKYWNIATPNRSAITSVAKEKDLTPEQKKYEWKLSIKSKDVDKNTLIIDVYDTYYELLKQNKDIEIKTKELNLVNAKFKQTSEKYKKGLISRNDYRLEQLNKKDVEAKLNASKRAQKRLGLKLYNLMGQGYSPDLRPLEEKLEYTDLKDINVDEAVKKAIENRIEMFKVNEEVTLKEKELEIVDKYYEDDQVEYNDAKNGLEEAKLNVDVKKQDIELEIRTSYNNLLNLLDTIEVNKQEVEKQQINSIIADLKNTLGMVTQVEVDEAKLGLEKAKVELDNSIIDYIIARQKFDLSIQIGTIAQVEM